MLFKKNLPIWERTLRSAAGLTMTAGGLMTPGLAGSPLGYVVAAMGAMIVLTGFVGYCPACAIAGRRPK